MCKSITETHYFTNIDYSVLTPTDVTKLQTAHFTDLAPYWYISSILQFPQFTCAT